MLTALAIARCALVGGVMGFLFFGALWLTVRRVEHARHPAVWMLLSYLVRLGLAGAGFLMMASEGLACVLAGLAAFLVLRQLWLRRVRRGIVPPADAGRPKTEEDPKWS